jgi:hypothetical protein
MRACIMGEGRVALWQANLFLQKRRVYPQALLSSHKGLKIEVIE